MSALRQGMEGVFLRTADPVTLSQLVRGDPRMAYLGIVAAVLVFAPLGFAIYDHGADFVPAYLGVMAGAFSVPLLVLAMLAVHRLHRLERIAERGERFSGTARRVSKTRGGAPGCVEVEYRRAAATLSARGYASLAMLRYVSEGSEVEILVDPAAPATAVIARAWPPRDPRP